MKLSRSLVSAVLLTVMMALGTLVYRGWRALTLAQYHQIAHGVAIEFHRQGSHASPTESSEITFGWELAKSNSPVGNGATVAAGIRLSTC